MNRMACVCAAIALPLVVGCSGDNGNEKERQGDDNRYQSIIVTVQEASIESAMFTDRQGLFRNTDEPCILIFLQIANHDEARRYRLTTWNAPLSQSGSLADEHGNVYRLAPLPEGSRLEWQNGGKGEVHTDPDEITLDPGKAFTYPIAFEAPVPQAKEFTLTLPKSNLGGSGSFRLKFSREAIQVLKP